MRSYSRTKKKVWDVVTEAPDSGGYCTFERKREAVAALAEAEKNTPDYKHYIRPRTLETVHIKF